MPAVAKQKIGPGRPQGELGELIERAVAETDDLQSAADALLRMCRSRPDAYQALMASHEYQAARAAVGVRVSRQRRAILSRAPDRQPVNTAGNDAANDRVMRLAQVNSSAFLDFALPGGKRLVRATAEQVREGAAFYLSRSADLGRKGRWLDRIAAALPEGRTVGEHFAEADLAQMFEAAQ